MMVPLIIRLRSHRAMVIRLSILSRKIRATVAAKELASFIIDDFFEFWVAQDHIQTGAIMIRKETIDIDALRMADLRNSQDWEYWMMVST